MLTNQEMFDRAVRGLASQGWAQAAYGHACRYQTSDGKRCAWGWVDLSLGEDDEGSVRGLQELGNGLAAKLSAPSDELEFAVLLQERHDISYTPDKMLVSFIDIGVTHSLTWPSDVPQELPSLDGHPER